jgi:rhamnosyltransferase
LSRESISVIIPTLNAEKTICRLIDNIHKQTFLPIEIFVIDSSSCDRTASLVASLGCKLIIIDRHLFDHGGTRDLVARQASGSILVFMTQDAIPCDNTLLENLVEPLSDRKIAASFAQQSPGDFLSPVQLPARVSTENKRGHCSLRYQSFLFQ